MTDKAGAPEWLRHLGRAVSNWGRWGPDDELGALNTITADARAAAAATVERGDAFALSIPLGADGPQTGQIGRINPVHTMSATGLDGAQPVDLGATARYTDDFVAMPLQCATHWDSLAHVFYEDTLYNGVPASAVDGRGASRNAIDRVHDRIVGRGVLLDIARLHGVDALPADHAVTTADLKDAERRAGVEVRAGDIVLVRTGLMGRWARTGSWAAFHGAQPGLHYETVRFLHERDVAAVAADNSAVEVLGRRVDGALLPFHMLALRDMGLHLGELWFLEALADDCEHDGRYDFLLVAPPLRVTGAVGAPVSPMAVK